MPRVRVGWIFVAVVFFSVFKEEITADLPGLPEDLTQIDAENLDGHVELSTLDVLPTTTPEQEHSTTHRTRKFLKWPSRRPAFQRHNGRDSTLKTKELSSIAASQESYQKEMDSTTEIQEQTTQSAETKPAKLHNRGHYRYIPPKSSIPSVRSSSTTTEHPIFTKHTTQAFSKEKYTVTPRFRKFLMRRKPESPTRSSENIKNEISPDLKLETTENSEILTGDVEVSSKYQEELLKKGDEVVELTKALLESEQHDQETFFKETGAETGETLFESGDPAESDLFEIDQNYNKFLMTEKPQEKVTVLLPASFNMENVEMKHDLEESTTISPDIQHPTDKVNEEVQVVATTTTKFVDEMFNLEATVSSEANPVDKIRDEIHTENSVDARSTMATAEHDKFSRLHKFLPKKSRFHSRARLNNNLNENSTEYSDRTTTTESNAAPEDSTTIQLIENNFVDTIETKHKITYMNLKHENSTAIHLADTTVEEKPTENYVTTEHNEMSPTNQLVDEKSKGLITTRIEASSLNENTDIKLVPTGHPKIIHMHRLPHMKPTRLTPTHLTKHDINGTSSDATKNLTESDLEQDVTISSDIHHSNEREDKEVEGITMKYEDGIFDFEVTGTTVNPVVEILDGNSANVTFTTTEHDELSHLHKFHPSRYNHRGQFGDNSNENSTKFSDRTTTEYTTIQNNPKPEDSTTTPLTDFDVTTKTKHKIPHMRKYLNLKHDNSTTIHSAELVEKSKGSSTSQLTESSLNETSTDVEIVSTKQPQIIHMHRLPHITPKNPTTTPLTEISVNGTSSDANKNSTKHKIIHMPKYPDLKHNNFTSSHLIEKIGNSVIENYTDTGTVEEHSKIFPVHRIPKIKQKNSTKTYITENSFNASSVNANSTETGLKSIRMQKYLNIEPKNATTTRYPDNSDSDENTAAIHKIIHMPRLLNTTPEYSTTTFKNGVNESSVDEITPSSEHKIIHMQKNLNMKLRNSTIHPGKHMVYENHADGNTSTREHHGIIHMQHLLTKPKSSVATHFTEKIDNETIIDILPVAHKVVHMHKYLNTKLKNSTTTLITEKSENNVETGHDKMIHINQHLDMKPLTHPVESSVDEISADANTVTAEYSKIISSHQYPNEKPEISLNQTKVVGGGDTTTIKYSRMNLEHKRSSEVFESNNGPTMNLLDLPQDYIRETISSPVVPEDEELQMLHTIEKGLESASYANVSVEETQSILHENINTIITSSPKAQYSTKPPEIIHSTSEMGISQTPDYTSTTIEEVTDENTDRVQYHESTHMHQSQEVLKSTSTESSDTTRPDITTETDNSYGFSKKTSHLTSVSSTKTTTESEINSEPIFSASDKVTIPSISTTLEDEMMASTQYFYKKVPTSPEILTDILSKVSTETAATSTLSPISTSLKEMTSTGPDYSSEFLTEIPHTPSILSTRTNSEEINSTQQYVDEKITSILGPNVSAKTDLSTELLKNVHTTHSIPSIRTSTEDPGVATVPLQQQGIRNKATIPRRQYLLKRTTTTTSPITTDQESDQGETVTESIVTSSIIHLQVHEETTILPLFPSTLAETTTYGAPYVKNGDVTSRSSSEETSNGTVSLLTENVSDSNDTTENSDGEIVTLDPANWFGVNIDITTEVPADKKDEIVDADTEEEKTVIVVPSIGSETEDTTTRVEASTKQIELSENHEEKLYDTSESVERLVTVDPAHWYGVEYDIENTEKAVATENAITLDDGSKTKTKDTSEIMIEIDSRFGVTVSSTNQTGLSSLNYVKDDVIENITKEIPTNGMTLITQNKTTSLQKNKTADKADAIERSRNTTQTESKEIHLDHQKEVYDSMKIEIEEAENISAIINNINQTVKHNEKVESTTKKSRYLSSDVIREHDKVSTSSPNNFSAESITDPTKLANVQGITSKNGNVFSDDAVSELSKTDNSTAFTGNSNLSSSNSSKVITEERKPVEKEEGILSGFLNEVHLDVASEFNTERYPTKLKEDAVVSTTVPEQSTNLVPVTKAVELNFSVSEGQSSEVALKNTIGNEGTEDKQIELDTEQKKMLFEKLGEVFGSNEDKENVSYNESESASFNNSSSMSGVDEEMMEDDEELEEDDDGGSDYMDIYAIDRANHEVEDVPKESYVEKNILGNAANFSVQLKLKQQTIHMPSDVHITEDPKHLVLNFTWPSSENTYNYSLSLHLNESAGRYLINKMHLNFVKDDLTLTESDQEEKNGSFVDLGEDIQVIFSNTDFLKISNQTEEDSEDLERATKERQERVLHMEIILGAVIVVGVIVLVIYILIARRRKLKSRKVEDKNLSSRL